jgi:hypothetical protein
MSKKLLRPISSVLVALALVLTVASCSDDAPTAPTAVAPVSGDSANLLGLIPIPILDPILDPVLNPLVDGLLACPVYSTSSASRTIGPDGGVLTVGRHSLVVPRGALSSSVRITATVPAGKHTMIHFEPEGLQFAKPTALTMSYSHCGLLGWLTPAIVYVDDDRNILEILPSLGNIFTRTVSSPLDHFSNYALADRKGRY